MSDLHVVATIPAKPGSEDTVREGLSSLAAESRKEEGCVSYELFESAAQPGTFVTVEVWANQEAVDAHMTSPHFQSAVAVFGEHLAGAPAIHPLKPVS
ncbi:MULTISPECIES: putative quinol monooxygenase [Rhodococcus]|jgi:quinol monooxygenase YgiN|uniref:Quinol monooxygenase n=1 Tax=Rhodococcus oxybenzonivorans TaxID=1990687 RepID=A0AAE4UZL5_9NOCA|nr:MULTISPECIES: putative quinol monooxygenase [Rhodococcus]MDV7246103.1 putative quinol monooxygenase [Rhodococcus oxybenzonivorans]MDV7266055.1 putative quinol monooxygenase [Rhodococcus oxybenzonivorans]MDV7277698.1 putative quinol monooxygenase [Rhodococcus oxybenzonivorans]MDV7337116.1 putative quinol monooxygenase [Rhodococcus oxybenzonivorans]MDV7347290.1 putative quinol monooxygenase [Rhodococcus oxybenzonivorans]